jgi:transcriptional regulator with XRE-family HTH domain
MSQFSLSELRKSAGLAQGVVARKVGISQATLCYYENGLSAPNAKRIAAITAAIKELSSNPFGDPPRTLTEYERRVWDEVSQTCPKGIKMPPRAQRIRLVRLLVKVRREGIGNRDGKHGVTVPELERLIFLFDEFRMTPASRGAVPWPEPQSATDVRTQLAAHGVK